MMSKDSVTECPTARKDQLIVKEVDGEVLVYDLQRDKAHCLNSTAAHTEYQSLRLATWEENSQSTAVGRTVLLIS